MELFLVISEIADAEGVRAPKSMAARGAACRDPGDRKLQRLAPEHRNDPTDRTDKARAVQASPGHGTRPGQIVNDAREDSGKNLLGGPPDFDLFGRQVLALGCLDEVKLVDMHV